MKEAFKYVIENVKGAKSSLIVVLIGIVLSFIIPFVTRNINQHTRFFIILGLCLVIGEELRRFTAILGAVYNEMEKEKERNKK
jgi:hypothetical protein